MLISSAQITFRLINEGFDFNDPRMQGKLVGHIIFTVIAIKLVRPKKKEVDLPPEENTIN